MAIQGKGRRPLLFLDRHAAFAARDDGEMLSPIVTCPNLWPNAICFPEPVTLARIFRKRKSLFQQSWWSSRSGSLSPVMAEFDPAIHANPPLCFGVL